MATNEGTQAAALIDRFPEDVRRRLLAGLARVVDVYRQTGVREDDYYRRAREEYLEAHPDELAEANVIPFRRRA